MEKILFKYSIYVTKTYSYFSFFNFFTLQLSNESEAGFSLMKQKTSTLKIQFR